MQMVNVGRYLAGMAFRLSQKGDVSTRGNIGLQVWGNGASLEHLRTVGQTVINMYGRCALLIVVHAPA